LNFSSFIVFTLCVMTDAPLANASDE